MLYIPNSEIEYSYYRLSVFDDSYDDSIRFFLLFLPSRRVSLSLVVSTRLNRIAVAIYISHCARCMLMHHVRLLGVCGTVIWLLLLSLVGEVVGR